MGYFGDGQFPPGYFAPGYFAGSVASASAAVPFAAILLLCGAGRPGTLPGSPSPDSFFEEDLLAHLAEVIGVAVYPGHIPRKADLPALSFFIVGGDHLQKLSGRAGQATARVQITASSKSYIEVGRLGLTLERALDGFRGPMGGTKVNSCIGGLQLTRYDTSVDASDRGVHEKIQEFTISFVESPNP